MGVKKALRARVFILTLAIFAAALIVAPALAHRPYFEEEDIRSDAPWVVDDPTISTAVYATLDTADDVDYFAFEGQSGQVVLLALTIPQIEGQEAFAPTLALLGSGLSESELPERVSLPPSAGVLEVPPPEGPAPTFFEPFSRTSYWERQEKRVTLPADGQYVVAVWHPAGEIGRYVFVIGDKERLGGDPAFRSKMRQYWTPVGSPPVEAKPAAGTVILWIGVGLLLVVLPLSLWLRRRALRRKMNP